ncbi:MAG: hypothetical protein ACJAZX_000806 [Rickettsiales bacterium]|jgi:hypothetical protein
MDFRVAAILAGDDVFSLFEIPAPSQVISSATRKSIKK